MTSLAARTGMRALVFTAPGNVELQDVPRPEPAEGETLVRVQAAGICGSELHGFRSVGFRKPPLIMGHEVAGTTPDGRRVVINPLITCGSCDSCLTGSPQLCRHRQLMGVHRPGGFTEEVVVPQSSLHELPGSMTWETAALVEPLANAVHAWQLAGLAGTERVAIIGAGTIGLVCLLVARARGVPDIVVVDRSPARLQLARRLGAGTCAGELPGEYDVVVDAVGSRATRRMSIESIKPGGIAVWIGLAEQNSGFDGNDLVRSEKRVLGSFAYTPEEFASSLALAEQLDLDWTTPVALEDAERAFNALAEGAMEPIKAVIRP